MSSSINRESLYIPAKHLSNLQTIIYAICLSLGMSNKKSNAKATRLANLKIDENQLISNLSQKHKCCISVYTKKTELTLYKSTGENYEKQVNLLKHLGKYYLIKKLESLKKIFECRSCGLTYTNQLSLNKHTCRGERYTAPFINHECRIFRDKKTLIEQIESVGLHVDKNHRFLLHKAVFDNESLITTYSDEFQTSEHLQKLEKHDIMLIGLVSDIPGFTEKHFFTGQTMMKDFVSYLYLMARKAAILHENHNQSILNELENMKNRALRKGNETFAKRIEGVLRKVKKFISRLQIYGFNNKKFDDSQLIYNGLIEEIFTLELKFPFVLKDKSPHHYVGIMSDNFCFKDILLFLGNACSLDAACKAYGINGMSLEQLASSENLTFDSLCKAGQKLKYPFSLNKSFDFIDRNFDDFTIDDFYSTLTGENLLSSDYQRYIQLLETMSEKEALGALQIKNVPTDPSITLAHINKIKRQLNLSHAQYLLAYCLADCHITLQLVDRVLESYSKIGMHFIHECFTLSSCSYKLLHRSIKEEPGKICSFYLLDEESHDLIKSGCIGGLCIAQNKLILDDAIEFHKFGPSALNSTCVKALDMVSLYPSSIYKNGCSTLGPPLIRKKESNFKVCSIGNYGREEFLSIACLIESRFKQYTCRTFFSPQGQKRIQLPNGTWTPLDLYVYELDLHLNYHSCFLHVCGKHNYDLHAIHPMGGGLTFGEMQARTSQIDDLLKGICNYECVWGCEIQWPSDKGPLTHYLYNRINHSYTESQLLTAIEQGKCHGIICLDLKMRDEALQNHMYKLPIIPVRQTISLNDLQPDYRDRLLQDGLMRENEKRETIVLSTRGTQVIINTVMLRFYLKFNLVECTNISKFIEFEHAYVLTDFYDTFACMRHKAKIEGNQIISTAVKSVICASYGRAYLNYLKRPKCKYFNDAAKFHRHQAKTIFHKQKTVGNLIEYSYFPCKIKSQNLVQLAFDFLCCSKTELFLFFYRYFASVHDIRSYSIYYLDTDCLIVKFHSVNDIENVAKGKEHEFLRVKEQLIQPDENSEAYRQARHFLGFMKLEFEGRFGIFLCSKLYSLLKESEVKHVQKGVPQTIRNKQYYAFMQKLLCLLGDVNQRATSMQRNAIVSSFKNYDDCLELVQISKRPITYVNLKMRWCCRFIHGYPHGLDDKQVATLFPYADHDCQITLEKCLETINLFIDDSKKLQFMVYR